MTDIADDLRERRRALQLRWKTLRGELKATEADLKALDRVLALVSPATAAAVTARGQRTRSATAGGGGLFTHGELAVSAFGALVALGRTATSSEVAVEMLRAKGMPTDDPRLPGLSNRVSAALGDWAAKGQVSRAGTGEDGRTVRWEAAAVSPPAASP